MSYREMKGFKKLTEVLTEQLRCLGYPRVVSMETFRTPDFDMMAKLLYWLVRMYDPRFSVPMDISNELARVQFVKSIAAFIVRGA